MPNHYDLPSVSMLVEDGIYRGDDSEGRPHYTLGGVLYRIDEIFAECYGETRLWVTRVHQDNATCGVT